MMNYIKAVNAYSLPVLLFDKPPTSHRCIITRLIVETRVLPFHCHHRGDEHFLTLTQSISKENSPVLFIIHATQHVIKQATEVM
jgi:hypothetical protein